MTAVTLLVVLVMGAISANAGVLVGDRTVSLDPCSADTKEDGGIILSDVMEGIIMHFGIIMHKDGIIMHKEGDVQTNCGIIMH